MEYFPITLSNGRFEIEGIRDAVKVVAISGPRAKRLADLALHKADLEFADASLNAINDAPDEPHVLREALWRSAIVHFLKCFGNGARFQLSPARIYRGEPPAAMLAFEYFKALRNKHVVHDESSYWQSKPGAVLNDGAKGYKIEKIVCFAAKAATLDQGSFGNLKLLIEKARRWVIAEFDTLCVDLTQELEARPYEVLASQPLLEYRVPGLGEIGQTRSAPAQ